MEERNGTERRSTVVLDDRIGYNRGQFISIWGSLYQWGAVLILYAPQTAPGVFWCPGVARGQFNYCMYNSIFYDIP